MNSIEYAQQLIRFDSTWYRSNEAVSDYLEQALRNLGFETERVEYTDGDGVHKVNVVGRKGEGDRGLAYFGHTDVVTSADWSVREHGPFEPVVRDRRLYGRGSTDMKGSVACMLAAVDAVQNRELRHPIYFSGSSDEEVNHAGAVAITKQSKIYRELVENRARGVVGEPTGLDVVYAHKGGCRFTVTSHGRAAHSSTREGINANLAMIPFLVEMKGLYEETETDASWMNNEFDPPTICLNLGINDHNRAPNITAPKSICTVGFRPMPGTDVEHLLERGRRCAQEHGLEFVVDLQHRPFRHDPQSAFARACVELTGSPPPRTVSYGTEASNFPDIEDLLVIGPGDIAQAHKSDEWISLDQLDRGQQTYGKLIEAFCLS